MALQGARMVVMVWMDQETARWPPGAIQGVLGAYGEVVFGWYGVGWGWIGLYGV